MQTRHVSLAIFAVVSTLLLTACGGGTPSTPSVVRVEIDQGPVSLLVNAQVQLTATVTTLGGASTAVVWASDDEATAHVDGSGLVLAKAAGSTTIRATSAVDASKQATVSVTVEPASSGMRFVTMSAGTEHTLAIDEHGSAWAWGRGWHGQLGTGELLGDVYRPVQVIRPVEVERFVAVAAGGYHSLGLDDAGRVWSWGNNAVGQLGLGIMLTDEAFPMMVGMPEGVTSFTAIAAGTNHSVALDQQGRAWAWGDGQTVGQGSYIGDQATPVQVATPLGVTAFTAITARGSNTFVLDQDGLAWGWGSNANNILGIWWIVGAVVNSPVSILMPVDGDGAIIPYSTITGGASLVLALDGAGRAWAWGGNFYGELGNGSTETLSIEPVEVTKDPSVSFVAVAAGGNHALALDSVGRAWAWGLATHGELGNGDRDTNHGTPVLVTLPQGVPSFSGIAAGYHYSLALDQDGAMWAWGRGAQGMRGDGTDSYAEAMPMPVVAP